jgi:hypothetical protein
MMPRPQQETVTARAHVGGHGRDWRRHHAKSKAQNDSKFNRSIREAAAQARADLSRVNACIARFEVSGGPVGSKNAL